MKQAVIDRGGRGGWQEVLMRFGLFSVVGHSRRGVALQEGMRGKAG